jgi:parallel beta-helix repeat protein
MGNRILGDEFGNLDGRPAAAIFLTNTGPGSTDNQIVDNYIRNHPQAGISISSTTYAEFPYDLGPCNNNLIDGNEILGSSNLNGEDASSGIVMVSNSSYNRIIRNKIHNNGHVTAGGYGIVISGTTAQSKKIVAASNQSPIQIQTEVNHGFSTGNRVGVFGVQGNVLANGAWTITVTSSNSFSLDGSTGSGAYTSGGLVGLAGTPRLSEVPTQNEITNNVIYSNRGNGVRLKIQDQTLVRDNTCYQNQSDSFEACK